LRNPGRISFRTSRGIDNMQKTIQETDEQIRIHSEIMDQMVSGKLRLPNDSLIITRPEIMQKMFTPRRLELMELISKKNPSTIKELVKMTGRLKQAVTRDLKYLELWDIVKLKKNGRTVKPIIGRPVVVYLPASKS